MAARLTSAYDRMRLREGISDDERQFLELHGHAGDDLLDAIGPVRRRLDETAPGHAGQTAGLDPVEQPLARIPGVVLRRTAADRAQPKLVEFLLRTDRRGHDDRQADPGIEG